LTLFFGQQEGYVKKISRQKNLSPEIAKGSYLVDLWRTWLNVE